MHTSRCRVVLAFFKFGGIMGNRRPRQSASGTGGRRRAPRSAALVAAGLVVAGLLSPVAAGSAGASGAPAKVRLGSPPEPPAGAAAVSGLTPAATLSVDVVLQPRDPAALTAYAQAVSTPGTALYRHYVTEPQFVARFGPTRGTIQSVKQALVDAGLHPGPVATNDLSIPVKATAAQLSSAFATGFRRYRLVGGRIAYANTAAPQVAGSVAADVQTVVGLDDLGLAQPAGRQSSAGGVPAASGPAPAAGTGGPVPCKTASTDAAEQGSYTANRVGTAYGFPSLYKQGDLGSGQAVALYELQGFGSSDITTYRSCFKTATSVTTVNVDGGPLSGSGVGEADVDIEQVMSLAPDVHVLVYQGPNNGAGGYDTYNSIITQDEAKVVSTSWGLCEQFTGSAAAKAESTLFKEAAAQGQSVVAASGDEGSEDCLGDDGSYDSQAVDDPASQPFVTGAGGTSWTALGSRPTESAWNEGPTCCWGAGGGGVSRLWVMPYYQQHTGAPGVIGADSSRAPCYAPVGGYCREVPDVSALAGPYPYLDYVSGSWGSWGGTSLSAPLWASLIALADASNSCMGKEIGFANPILYRVAASDPTAFNDVTVGDNDLTGKLKGKYPATTGYDMATGLGTPNAAVLPDALCGRAAADPVSVKVPATQHTHYATAATLQIRASDTTAGQKLTYRAIGLPPGMSISSTTGLIHGTPTTWGTYAPYVSVRNASGAGASASFSWVVSVAITSATHATATIGKSFSFTVRATGVANRFTVSPKPPAGLRFKNLGNGTATLSGVPSAQSVAKKYPLVFEATFGTLKAPESVSQSFTLTLVH